MGFDCIASKWRRGAEAKSNNQNNNSSSSNNNNNNNIGNESNRNNNHDNNNNNNGSDNNNNDDGKGNGRDERADEPRKQRRICDLRANTRTHPTTQYITQQSNARTHTHKNTCTVEVRP